MDTRHLLAKHPLFAKLPSAIFETLVQSAEAIHLDTGAQLTHAAAPCLVTRGSLHTAHGSVTDGDLFMADGTYALTTCTVLQWPAERRETLDTLRTPYDIAVAAPSSPAAPIDNTTLTFACVLQVVYAGLEVAPWLVISPLVDHCLLYRDTSLWPTLLAALLILAIFGIGASMVHGVLVTPLATAWATALRRRTIATIFHSVAMPHLTPSVDRWWQRLRTTLRAIDQLQQHGALWVHETSCVTFCLLLSACLAPKLTAVCVVALLPLAVWRMVSGRMQVQAAHELFVFQLLRTVHGLLVLALAVRAVRTNSMRLGTLVAVMGLWLSAWDSSMHLLPLRSLPDPKKKRSAARLASAPAFMPRAHAVFKQVTLVYPGATQAALTDFSLDLPPGTAMGIVGRSGAGKSTVARLLVGMISATRGQVTLDGLTPQLWGPASRRDQLAWLDDRPFLPHPTLFANLSAGANAAALARMRWACELCELQPDTLRTVHDDETLPLRISLARALMRRPRLLLLDDFFARMDHASIHRLLTNVRAAAPDMTLLVLSRVPQALGDLPHVLVLQAGTVVASGAPQTLLQGPGLYHYLHAEYAP